MAGHAQKKNKKINFVVGWFFSCTFFFFFFFWGKQRWKTLESGYLEERERGGKVYHRTSVFFGFFFFFALDDSDATSDPHRPSTAEREVHAGYSYVKNPTWAQNDCFKTPHMNRFALDLITTRSRCLRISLQPDQQFPELLLPRTCRASPRPLPAQIDQLGNPLPTGAARARVFATGEEFLFILARFGKRLVLLPVIVLVELVRPFLSRGDCVRLFLRRDFCTAFKVEITAFPPLSVGTKVCVSGTSHIGRTREWQ